MADIALTLNIKYSKLTRYPPLFNARGKIKILLDKKKKEKKRLPSSYQLKKNQEICNQLVKRKRKTHRKLLQCTITKVLNTK